MQISKVKECQRNPKNYNVFLACKLDSNKLKRQVGHVN